MFIFLKRNVAEQIARLTVMLPLSTFIRTSGGKEEEPVLVFASLIFLQ